jgi:hypothetical protein
MRLLFGLLVILVMSTGIIGDGHSKYAIGEASSQASPTPVPKCIIPPAPPGDGCHLSRGKKEFIRWQAPANEDLYVCFTSSNPFSKKTFHIPAGKYEDTKFRWWWFVSNGTIDFTFGPTKCPQPPSEKNRSTAKVIIED